MDHPGKKEIKKIDNKNQAHLKKCAFCIKATEKITKKPKTEKVIFCDGRHKKIPKYFLRSKTFSSAIFLE